MTLIKTSLLSAIATLIKMISGFIITKIIAVYMGPAGLAIIGQFQNFINIIYLVSGDFLKTAITKYTAEYYDNEKYRLWSSAILIVFILNIVMIFILWIFSQEIAVYILKSDMYSHIIKILALGIPLFVLNTIFLAILNGKKKISKYISINISLSLISLFLIYVLSTQYALEGALIAYVTNQSIIFLVTLYFVWNESWFKVKNFFYTIEYKSVRKILGFALITFFSVMASNGSLLYIRNFITETISVSAAGYWQGIWVLSQVVLMFITTSLITYFLPTISRLKLKEDISKELKKVMILVIPIVIIASFSMYILRDFIISILYTSEFSPMRELFLWQMIGNIIKVLGWVFGYVLVAKAMVKYTISTEMVFASTFVLLSMYCIHHYGLVGVTYAYGINNVLHAITMYYLYRYKLTEGS